MSQALTREDVQSRVLQVTNEHLHGDKVATVEATFASLDMDSLDEVELVMGIEDEFGIEIPDEDAQKFTKVGEIIDWVMDK